MTNAKKYVQAAGFALGVLMVTFSVYTVMGWLNENTNMATASPAEPPDPGTQVLVFQLEKDGGLASKYTLIPDYPTVVVTTQSLLLIGVRHDQTDPAIQLFKLDWKEGKATLMPASMPANSWRIICVPPASQLVLQL